VHSRIELLRRARARRKRSTPLHQSDTKVQRSAKRSLSGDHGKRGGHSSQVGTSAGPDLTAVAGPDPAGPDPGQTLSRQGRVATDHDDVVGRDASRARPEGYAAARAGPFDSLDITAGARRLQVGVHGLETLHRGVCAAGLVLPRSQRDDLFSPRAAAAASSCRPRHQQGKRLHAEDAAPLA
jgi:hypothetical protein